MPSVLYLIVRSWAPALTMKFPTRFVNTHLHLFGYHRVGRLHVLTSFFCTFDNSQQIDRSKYTRSPLFMQNEHARTRKTWTSVRTLRYLYFFPRRIPTGDFMEPWLGRYLVAITAAQPFPYFLTIPCAKPAPFFTKPAAHSVFHPAGLCKNEIPPPRRHFDVGCQPYVMRHK